MTPPDHSIILTAMFKAEKIAKSAGQGITVFTADQQLYRVVLDIVWSDPVCWTDFIPCIGGMHWLMSFIGCAGELMSNSGLSSWRFSVLELLRGFVDDMVCYDDLVRWLKEISSRSVWPEHWVKNLIS